MPANDPKVMTIVAEALKRTDPAARATYLDSVCGDDADFRRQVEALLATHDAAGRPVEADATGMHESTSPETLDQTPAPDAATLPPSALATGELRSDGADFALAVALRSRPARRIRSGPGHRRPVLAARSPRRGGDGHRLPGKSDRTGQTAGGTQADQDRHGLACRAGPVRRRAAGTGLDGPPQHRPGLRRGHHRGRPTVLRDGARRRGADHRVLRPQAAAGPGPPGVVRHTSARPCSTPTRRGSSTAT